MADYTDVVMNALGKKLTDKLLKEVNLDDLANQLRPNINKALKQAFDVALENDFAYELSERLWENGYFDKVLKQIADTTLKSTFPATPKKKVTKKRTK